MSKAEHHSIFGYHNIFGSVRYLLPSFAWRPLSLLRHIFVDQRRHGKSIPVLEEIGRNRQGSPWLKRLSLQCGGWWGEGLPLGNQTVLSASITSKLTNLSSEVGNISFPLIINFQGLRLYQS